MSFARAALRIVLLACVAGVAAPATTAASSCLRPGADTAQCRADEISRLDREVSQAYSSALAMMDALGRQRLRRDQDAYERVRKADGAGRLFDLAAQMTLRRDFLKAITEPKGRWAGHWASAAGTVDITAGPNGSYRVRALSAEPTLGTWMCEFEDSALLAGSVMFVGAMSAKLDLGGPNEGWTLALRMMGDTLQLDALPPQGVTGKPPFCGEGGQINGSFFAQSAPPRATAVKQ